MPDPIYKEMECINERKMQMVEDAIKVEKTQ